ncbi:MAG: PIG-L deacetylase family protein [Candidatus Aminicenantales bacterium]
MRTLFWPFLFLFVAATFIQAGSPAREDPAAKRLRVLIIGAHPDDPDDTGGTAAKYIALGHEVKMISLTNGNAGHQSQGGGPLARRRAKEARRAGAVIGAAYQVLDNADGELMPTLENRRLLIRLIREFRPDIIFGPRPNDYHPDHRYAAVLLQDAAYMVTVPNIEPQTPILEKMPVIMYVSDFFRKPLPFRPDVAVDITDAVEKKLDMLDCHESQMYEWLPFNRGRLADVPSDKSARRAWLGETRKPAFAGEADQCREALAKLYGAERAATIKFAEGFECSEYGSPLTPENLEILFPFFKRQP